DLAYVFVAAVLGGGLAWLARQPLILGYVAGGLLVSPLTPGPSISDVHTFELFAEIGVVLLMFSLGIEFSLKDLMRVKWVAVLGGPLGIVLSVALGLVTGAALGWSAVQGAIVGMVVSVARTMVLARLLLDRGVLRCRAGRRGAHAGRGAVVGARGVPGRPAHQPVGLRPRDTRAPAAASRRVRRPFLRDRRHPHRPQDDHHEPAPAWNPGRPRHRRQV